MNRTYEHLFGPVPSRRLGRSLGLDMVPFKTCSFDCIFCQLGHTTDRTMTRKEYVSTDEIMNELDDWLKTNDHADYITLAGSGEPTLHSGLGRMIEFTRGKTNIPVALLTNGSLLSDPDVREQAANAHLVKISLSAWDQASLEHVNRPHPALAFDQMFEGMRLFRNLFHGQLWVEVFLVWGTNSTPEDVSRIAERVRLLKPDKVQFNTSVRPPCEEYAYALPLEKMETMTRLFVPPAEIIAEFPPNLSARFETDENAIFHMLERRPCTLDQICSAFGLHRNEAGKHLGKLTRTGRACELRSGSEIYFSALRGKDA